MRRLVHTASFGTQLPVTRSGLHVGTICFETDRFECGCDQSATNKRRRRPFTDTNGCVNRGARTPYATHLAQIAREKPRGSPCSIATMAVAGRPFLRVCGRVSYTPQHVSKTAVRRFACCCAHQFWLGQLSAPSPPTALPLQHWLGGRHPEIKRKSDAKNKTRQF